jgi:hypothetical protein
MLSDSRGSDLSRPMKSTRVFGVAVGLISVGVRSRMKTAVFGADSAFRSGAPPYDFVRFRHQEATGDAPHSSETEGRRAAKLRDNQGYQRFVAPRQSTNRTEHHPSSGSPIVISIAALSHEDCRAARRTTSSTSDGPVRRVGSGDARDIAVGKSWRSPWRRRRGNPTERLSRRMTP